MFLALSARPSGVKIISPAAHIVSFVVAEVTKRKDAPEPLLRKGLACSLVLKAKRLQVIIEVADISLIVLLLGGLPVSEGTF